jgi:hypothetical protein
MEETSRAPAPPEPVALADESDRILLAAGDDADRLDWDLIKRLLADRPGYPVQITKGPPRVQSVVAAPSPASSPRETPVDNAATGSAAAPAQPAKSPASVQPASAVKSAASAPAATAGGASSSEEPFQPRPISAPRR